MKKLTRRGFLQVVRDMLVVVSAFPLIHQIPNLSGEGVIVDGEGFYTAPLDSLYNNGSWSPIFMVPSYARRPPWPHRGQNET